MNYNIRPYTKSDISIVRGWWETHGEPPPPDDCIPVETSFIMEIEGVPTYSLCVTLTNTLGFCWISNYVKNPIVTSKTNEYGKIFLAHVDDFIRKLGYKRAIMFSMKDKLTAHYNELGYEQKGVNIVCHVKEL